jgi:hypothetical protein
MTHLDFLFVFNKRELLFFSSFVFPFQKQRKVLYIVSQMNVLPNTFASDSSRCLFMYTVLERPMELWRE